MPMDQPKASLKMLSTFLYGLSFDDSPQRLQRSVAENEACECPQDAGSEYTNDANHTSEGKRVIDPSWNQTAASNSVIVFAWVAALVVVIALVFYVLMKRRHRDRFILASTLDEDEYDRDASSIEVNYPNGILD